MITMTTSNDSSATVNVLASKTAVESNLGFTFLKYNHVELSLERIRVIFKAFANELDKLIAGHGPEDRVRIVEWCERYCADKSNNCNMAAAQLYPTLCYLLEGYPGIEVKRGRHGGAYRIV
jgi:hypothetical protein